MPILETKSLINYYLTKTEKNLYEKKLYRLFASPCLRLLPFPAAPNLPTAVLIMQPNSPEHGPEPAPVAERRRLPLPGSIIIH